MTSIVVCPLSKLETTLESSGALHLISLLSGETEFERPGKIAAKNHLTLRFNDISVAQDGLVSPDESHIFELLHFARGWNRTTPLLVHCWAGISRSPAAAAIIALALEPCRNEHELAGTLRNLAPSATPNRRMIELGDALLERQGKFSAAIKTIGRGADAFEGAPFQLQL